MDDMPSEREYRIYCDNYAKFCEIETEMKKTEKDSEKYERLLGRADELYMDLLQWYQYLVASASITVTEVKIRRNKLRNRKED